MEKVAPPSELPKFQKALEIIRVQEQITNSFDKMPPQRRKNRLRSFFVNSSDPDRVIMGLYVI